MNDDLFRQEAVDAQRNKLMGDAAIAQPLSYVLFFGLLISLFISAIFFLSMSEYSRKEKIVGRLTPTKGIVRMNSPTSATIVDIYVDENDLVKKGQPLIRLKREQKNWDGASTSEQLLEQISLEATELSNSIKHVSENFRVLRKENTTKLDGLKARQASVQEQVAVLRNRFLLAKKRVEALSALLQEKAASPIERDEAEEEKFLVQQEYLEIKAAYVDLLQNIEQLEVKKERIDAEEQQALSQLRGDLAVIEQRKTRIKSETNFLLTSPVNGSIAALQSRVGQTVSLDDMQLAILPTGGSLVAELYAPTRAAGLIEIGQTVRLLYDAFPYQRFGSGIGTVTSISKTILLPEDGPSDFNISEPVYIVTVSLDAQSVTTKTNQFALQDGMSLTADVILEKRTILEWLLTPARKLFS